MIAREARRLRPGDAVLAAFSNSHLVARVELIAWPKFMVRGQLVSGRLATVVRHYRTLDDIGDRQVPHWFTSFPLFTGTTPHDLAALPDQIARVQHIVNDKRSK